jgi:hypothetical protein
MDIADAAALLPPLLAGAGLPPGPGREPIRVWARSGVERLHLAGGGTAVFKYAQDPFDREHHALALAARHGVPVPRLLAARTVPGLLGMLLEDLGHPLRDAGEHDAAQAAARVHRVPADAGWLPCLDQETLAGLPAQIAARAARLSHRTRLRLRAQPRPPGRHSSRRRRGDAASILAATPAASADVCLSIFGAFSFSPPRPLLAAAAHALRPAAGSPSPCALTTTTTTSSSSPAKTPEQAPGQTEHRVEGLPGQQAYFVTNPDWSYRASNLSSAPREAALIDRVPVC